MTPISQLYFAAFVIIGFELMLMVYIYVLQPQMRANQLFAVYMLMLSVSSYSILVASTAGDAASLYNASRNHAVATMVAGPLLWLLLFYTFIPRYPPLRWLTPLLLGLASVPLIIGIVDSLTVSPLLFEFKSDLYLGGYVPISSALNGRWSAIFYPLYISLPNSLLLIPISIFAFTRLLPDRRRRAARVLLLLSVSVGLLYLPLFDVPSALRSMLTPVFAATGAAWVMGTYRFFSPMRLAMKQVVDSVAVGLLVFNDRLLLMDANAFSLSVLPIVLPEDRRTLTLPVLLQRLLPNVVNEAELVQLQAALALNPEHAYQQEITLRDGRSGEALSKWFLFNSRPVYDENQLYLGLSCSIEDLTIERRAQAHINEAHKAIEQYSYNQAFLNDITQTAISGVDFEATLSTLASRLAGLFEADHCYISLWDDAEQRAKPGVAFGKGTETYLSIKNEPGELTLSMEIYRQARALAIEDLHNSTYIRPNMTQYMPSRGLLGLPMIADGQRVGALLIGFEQPRQFSAEEVQWGEQIASQLTLAIFMNRLLDAERQQRAFSEALQTAGQALTSTLDFEQVLDRILDEIVRVVPCDTVNFALIKKDEAHIVRKRDLTEPKLDIRSHPEIYYLKISQMPTLQKMYVTKRPLRISDTTLAPEWKTIVRRVKSWMGVPLIVGNEPIAFLMVDKLEANFYQAQHEKWLVAFATQAALALQHAQLFTEIQRRVNELEALSRVSAALRSSETIPVILHAVLESMVNVLSARVGVAFLLDEARTAVVSNASYPENFYPMGIRYALGEGITGLVAKNAKMHLTSNLHDEPKWEHKPGEPEAIKELHSTIALPLISEEGILGVIHLGLASKYDFAEDEIRTLKAMSNIVANGLQRIQVMQTLEERVTSRTYDLETANERLQELDKLKTKFIADVSHELRTPVANLTLYVDLLRHGKMERQADYLAILEQQATRLTNLVEATLGLSKLDAGSQAAQFGPVMLNELVQDVVLGHQARAQALDLQLTHRLEPGLPPVWGNKTQLAQLITNLVTNAINYNRVNGKISVETYLQNDTAVCLKVVDNGMGISTGDQPYLFDRFYRGNRTGQSNIPGTGLGLAIVKEIVDLHQGKIEVTSQQNEGSMFLVQLCAYESIRLSRQQPSQQDEQTRRE